MKIKMTGKKIQQARNSHLLKKWMRSLDTKFTIRGIEIQSADTVTRKGKEEIIFLKIKADIVDPDGRALQRIIFLRGDAVAILIVISTSKNKYVVLVQSSMPAIGKRLYLQLPAGMMDGESSALKVAKREMKEETCLDPRKGKMVSLGHIYPSPGACDEAIHLFLFDQHMTEKEVKNLQGRLTGLKEEHEYLSLVLVKIESLPLIADVKAHSAYLRYQTLKK